VKITGKRCKKKREKERGKQIISFKHKLRHKREGMTIIATIKEDRSTDVAVKSPVLFVHI
jgi:hypothetical protein